MTVISHKPFKNRDSEVLTADMAFVWSGEVTPMSKILQPVYKVNFCCCLSDTGLISCHSQDYSHDDVHFFTIRFSAASKTSDSF